MEIKKEFSATPIHELSGRFTNRSSLKKLLFFLILLLPQVSSAVLNKPALVRAERFSIPRTQFEISVQIDPLNRSYSGHQKVTFYNQQNKATNYLVFYIYPNDPSIAKSKEKNFTVSHVESNRIALRTEEKGPFLKVFLPKELLPESKVIIELDFVAKIPVQTGNKDLFSETMDQFMKLLNPASSETEKDYGIFSSNKDILNLGLWYPALSKYDEEGWDEEQYSGIGDVSYFDPSDFKVHLTLPQDYQVVTTGTVLKKIPQKNRQILHYIESPLTRDFVIQLSARYQEVTKIKNLTTIRSYFLQEHQKSGNIVSETAVKAFEYYEKIFGPYPYTELDVVEAPLYGGAGGVEFPGLVTISSLLFKSDSEPAQKDLFQQLMANNPALDQMLEFVVAHEVAHQWWNAVVGSNSKKYPFIDEAMTNYSAVMYFEHYYGREAAEKQMALQMKLNYQLHRLLGGEDKVVELPTSSFKGSMEYSAIVYGKGALFYDHLRSLIGAQAFEMTMRKYYDAFWFRIAKPDDFKRMTIEQSPNKKVEIEALFQRWLKEKHGDEDIGAGDLDTLMKTMLSGIDSKNLDNSDLLQNEELLKQLEELLKQ